MLDTLFQKKKLKFLKKSFSTVFTAFSCLQFSIWWQVLLLYYIIDERKSYLRRPSWNLDNWKPLLLLQN